MTNLGGSNPTTILLAKRLVDIAPAGLNHVFFSDDGATAVEVAVKMAFQYWRQRGQPLAENMSGPLSRRERVRVRAERCKGADMGSLDPDVAIPAALTPDPSPKRRGEIDPEKTCYLALGEAYHGDTLGSVSVGGVERFHAMFRPLLFETLRVPAPDSYRTPPGVAREDLCQYHLDNLEQVLAQHHGRIAALVIEPLVQAAAGMIMHPPGYLRGVRELTGKYDVLLIADEVAVGFGRTGRMFACEHEDVSPDLLCLAKGLTGGYLPMAATLATDKIWQAFLGTYAESKTFYHGHTYGGNPLGAAAALASLDVFQEEHTLEMLPPKIARLKEHLTRIARLAHVGDVRQRSLIAAIELVRNVETKEPYPWEERRGQRVCDFARTQGVWLRPLGNVIVVMPPLAITFDQLDQIMRAVEQGITSCARANTL